MQGLLIDSCCEAGDGLILQGFVVWVILCISGGWQHPGTLRESCYVALTRCCPNLVFASPTKTRTVVLGDCDKQKVLLVPPSA